MKKTIVKSTYQFLMLFVFNCLAFIASAQDQSATQTTSTTTKTESVHFYMQPWAWVVGGVLLLIILIALFRGRGTDKTVTRTTIIK